jgi:hypothetical protein
MAGIGDLRFAIVDCRLMAEDVAIPVLQSAISSPQQVNHRSPITNRQSSIS